MKNTKIDFKNENISRIILKLAPPVMLAQLIQALYNVVDSIFIGRYDQNGLTALSIIYPVQLLMIALAVGTGVGINTGISRYNGLDDIRNSREISGVGTPLAAVLWLIFAGICWLIMPWYAKISTDSSEVIRQTIIYGRVVCVGSIGLFFESIWTKIHQANGNMLRPMAAQIVGALVNIVLDPILIFALDMGICGAAFATVAGQTAAALLVMHNGFYKPPKISGFKKHIKDIYRMGAPNILMQSAYTFYIFGLNMILAGFCDQAVTALGLYYKWQSFFFIPLGALQTCIVPVLSFNFARHEIKRCRKTLFVACMWGLCLMSVGMLCFVFIPDAMLKVFSSDPLVISIGSWGFRFVGLSFLGMVFSLIFPVFFQATNCPVRSSLLTILRTVVLFVPLGYIFAGFGLKAFWLTYPVTEIITSIAGFIFYLKFIRFNQECNTDYGKNV